MAVCCASYFCPRLGLSYEKGGIIASGANKEVYRGSYCGTLAAVCISRPGHSINAVRIKQEIDVMKRLGKHPYIISMLSYGHIEGRPFVALEAVQPIGYDLSKLVNQYSWARVQVPSALTARIVGQLAGALQHMHRRGLLHRDLKTENVLVNGNYDVRLIDFGIACDFGLRQRLQAGYLAPELCDGDRPLGREVDCWGVGLILHQMYQRQWDLVNTRSQPARLRAGMPSDKFPMDPDMKKAMRRLLRVEPEKRWTLPELLASPWIITASSKSPADRRMPSMKSLQPSRGALHPYICSGPPLTAFAACLDRDSKVLGEQLSTVGLRPTGALVLLVESPDGLVDTCPGPSTTLSEGSWVYFGIPQDERMNECMHAITKLLFSYTDEQIDARNCAEEGNFLAFTLEFDCFTFPKHLGGPRRIGPKPTGDSETERSPPGGVSNTSLGALTPAADADQQVPALDLRRNFGINLAGIVRQGVVEPIWFPGPSALVCPGDLGLVVRRPCRNGTTMPTVHNSELEHLMDEVQFVKKLGFEGGAKRSCSGLDGLAREKSLSRPNSRRGLLTRTGTMG